MGQGRFPPGGHAGVGGNFVADIIAVLPHRSAGGPLAFGAVCHWYHQVVQVALMKTVLRRHLDHLAQGIGEPHPGQAEQPFLHRDAANLQEQGFLVLAPEDGLVDLAQDSIQASYLCRPLLGPLALGDVDGDAAHHVGEAL